jgi:DNA (cytosine-5)-methyltransferase 1
MRLGTQDSGLRTFPQRPIAVDLFAGAGGFSLGMEQAGFDVLVAVEYDPVHACTYSFNFPLTSVICADASNVTGKMIKQACFRSWEAHQEKMGVGNGEWGVQEQKGLRENNHAVPGGWDGQIDLVFGGPPCQGFSIMGKRDFDDNRNNLVSQFHRLVIELNPRYFVMENVPGMAAGEYKNWLLELIDKFEDSGYHVEKGILNAADFGVPQKRKRLFIIGSFQGREVVNLPVRAEQKITVGEALADLPNLDNFLELATSDEVPLTSKQLKTLNEKSSQYVQMLRPFSIPPTSPSHGCPLSSYPRLWNPHILTSSMQTQHKQSSKIRFAETQQGQLEPISRLRRLKQDGLSHTLRAGTDKERGSHTSPRPIHPTLPRVISVREAARLHSFPDWFRFHQTKWHGFRQVGNSVPPLLGQAVGEKIIAALGVVPFLPPIFLPLGDTQLLRFVHSQARDYWFGK